MPGDNGDHGALTDGEMQALFLKELTTLERLIVEQDRIKADVRNQRKRMKSDGFERFEVDYALNLRKRKEDEMVEERRREARVARWLAHPIGTQADMFNGEQEPRGNGKVVPIRDPHALGKAAGAEGATCKPPQNLSQDDAQRWITGWHEGQQAMAGAGIKAPEHRPDFQE